MLQDHRHHASVTPTSSKTLQNPQPEACRPMQNRRFFVQCTGSSDSEDDLQRGEWQDPRRLRSSPRPPLVGHRCHTPPDAVAPTSQQGSPARRLVGHAETRSRLSRSCRNKTITRRCHRWCTSHHDETLHCLSGTCRPQSHVRQPPRSLDGSKVFKTTPQRGKAT
jgi:hypothetical protein